MEKKYIVSIDFGHSETCASRIPGYGNEFISHIPLVCTGNKEKEKVLSAICGSDSTGWKIVTSDEDLSLPGLIQSFKGPPSELLKEGNEVSKKANVEYIRQIFDLILKNDSDLVYDPETGESNFTICIANPTQWRIDDPNAPMDYIRMCFEAAGVRPVRMCINESDAAFFNKFDEFGLGDTVLIFDLGSLSVDYTVYSGGMQYCCGGRNIGAHQIENGIVEYGLNVGENRRRVAEIQKKREEMGLGSVDQALLLMARTQKERFFSNSDPVFRMSVLADDVLYGLQDEELGRPVFYIGNLKREDMYHVEKNGETGEIKVTGLISGYVNDLYRLFRNVAGMLSGRGITPDVVVLSGGACRMDFVQELAQAAFPNADVRMDRYPEWIVADGAAKYMYAQQKALKRIDELSDDDYGSLYISADREATVAAVRELFQPVADRIKNGPDCSCHEIVDRICSFFCGLNNRNSDYVAILNRKFNSIIGGKITGMLRTVIGEAFGIEPNIPPVNVNMGVEAFNWDSKEWDGSRPNSGYRIVYDAVREGAHPGIGYDFYKLRSHDRRVRIADHCLNYFVTYPFNVTYNGTDIRKMSLSVRREVRRIAEEQFHGCELFRTTCLERDESSVV